MQCCAAGDKFMTVIPALYTVQFDSLVVCRHSKGFVLIKAVIYYVSSQ